MSATLSLVTHPDDPTLLEIMLDEGQGDHRVARAPISDPRAWEWTTPPSWLTRGAVEALLDLAEGRLAFEFWDRLRPARTILKIEGPRSTPKSVARDQARALALLGERTGDFVQVA